uniref:Uncharacterized protein n=1 Tax=Aegilops tauschii subsp. strangulata TaxID=200361 RepID=A0A453JR92_AEGTS
KPPTPQKARHSPQAAALPPLRSPHHLSARPTHAHAPGNRRRDERFRQGERAGRRGSPAAGAAARSARVPLPLLERV